MTAQQDTVCMAPRCPGRDVPDLQIGLMPRFCCEACRADWVDIYALPEPSPQVNPRDEWEGLGPAV